MDILQLLPRNVYNAAVGAASPSASNVFATMNDIAAIPSNNIYNSNGSLDGNRTVTLAGFDLNFVNGASSRFFIKASNGFIGIGNSSPQARLDLLAQGATPGDNIIRLRNSTDTANLFILSGNGQSAFNGNTIANVAVAMRGLGTTSTTGPLRLENSANTLVCAWSDAGVMSIGNGTAPVASITDGFLQYSADIIAGNAAPHFRTENGSIVKLYQEAAVTTTQGLADALTNLGLLASSTIAAPVSTNIYNSDGTLTGARVVTMGANTLTFSGNQLKTGGVTIGNNIFNVLRSTGADGLIIKESGAGQFDVGDGVNSNVRIVCLSTSQNISNGGGGGGIHFQWLASGVEAMRINSESHKPVLIGWTSNPPAGSGRLDIRAQGSTSGNMILRLRNSTDTSNLFLVTGDGGVTVSNSGGRVGFYGTSPVLQSQSWTAITGTASKVGFDTTTGTLNDVKETLKAIQDQLIAMGILKVL